MRIANKYLLRAIFAAKGNLALGPAPEKKVFNGVEVAPFKNNARAAACISADLELNWAWRGRNPEEVNNRGRSARQNIPHILQLLNDYRLPITWATVGHLFLESCSRGPNGGLPHRKMPRPIVNERWNGDWYLHDPCTNVRQDPLWYAPDLIQEILQQETSHEIGTHSFSHINFSSECSTRELVRREIQECIKVMQSHGLKTRSLVYPFNRMGNSYLDLLSELNITAVRQRDKRIRMAYPERTESGVYRIYESMNLRTPKHYRYLDKAKIFVTEAIRRRAVYHLWFHPSDPWSVFKNEFGPIVEYIARERKKGVLWVATMGELAAYCEAREKFRLEVAAAGDTLELFFVGSFDRDKYGSTELTLLIPAGALPREALLKFEDKIEEVMPERSPPSAKKPRIRINVPVTAKSLKITFNRAEDRMMTLKG